jgi:predicted porin
MSFESHKRSPKTALRAGLIAAAALLVAASASAQTSATLYGIVDMFVQYGHGSEGNGFSVQSGGVSSSRLGVKGSEDLGGGLSARFQLEQGILADTGALGQGGLAWGRQAWVGVASTTWGALSLGRQNVPQYVILDSFDTFGTGAGSSAESGVFSTISRADNSVVYQTPSLGGWQGSVMAATGESTLGGDLGNKYALGSTYTAGAFSAGLAINVFKATASTNVDSRFLLLTAAYDFGGAKVSGALQSVRNAGHVDTDDRREAMLGVTVPVTARDTLSAAVGASRTAHTSGGSAVQWSLGEAHALSKRTKLYAVASFINNGGLKAYTTTAATGEGPTTTAGKDVSSLQVGIRHAF